MSSPYYSPFSRNSCMASSSAHCGSRGSLNAVTLMIPSAAPGSARPTRVGEVQVPEMKIVGSQLEAVMALRALGQASAVVPRITASASLDARLVTCDDVSGLVDS